ncbi:MAG: LacI family DNA-binding transcriptional regulator [Lachnospiraceae bacterium]|nr:LacI family DNA-binding transcriptional regulator [Lachnospiraceae bacterium]
MGKVTIKDVAREAGVSISTVSNALNDVDVLRPDTKAHILEVAERLHYVPNLNGRNLKAGATKVIGLFVPFIGGPYMGALADTMANKCRAAGYELHVFVTTQRRTIMTNLLGGRVDGAVILNSELSARQEKQLQEAEVPVVYLNREKNGTYQAGVFFDSYQAGRMAAEYILKLGVTIPGFIIGPDNYDSNERGRGFREVLDEQGITLKEEFVWNGNFSREETYVAVKTFLEKLKQPDGKSWNNGAVGDSEASKHSLPQAIFAANDQSAIGCMEALAEAGIAVPESIKVIGCDDIELGRYLTPSLTTIRTNFEEQGAVATECLLSMLQGATTGRLEKLSCKLVERESTGL